MRKIALLMALIIAVIGLSGCGRSNIYAPTPTSVIFKPSPVPTSAANEADQLAASINNGKALFQKRIDQAGFACSNCHNSDTADRLVGPGLLGIGEIAGTMVEGQSAEAYLHESIVNPGAHVVEDYPDGVMPQIYSEVFTNDEIDDLVNYLMSL